MHESRKVAWIMTIIAVVVAMFMIIVAFRRPQGALLVVVFAPLFAFTAGVGFVIALQPDSWHQARAERQDRWWNQHPKIKFMAILLGLGGLIFNAIQFVRSH